MSLPLKPVIAGPPHMKHEREEQLVEAAKSLIEQNDAIKIDFGRGRGVS